MCVCGSFFEKIILCGSLRSWRITRITRIIPWICPSLFRDVNIYLAGGGFIMVYNGLYVFLFISPKKSKT